MFLHAGIAVVFVMTLTSAYLVLVMIMIWKTHILLIISYVLIIASVELLYLSSVLYKFDQGGYLPLAFATLMVIIMFFWNDVYRRKYYYEVEHKVSPDKFKQIADDRKICRMPGFAIFYSELVHGIPPIVNHYVANVPALHSVLVFVSIRHLPISKIPIEERLLFRRIEPIELNVFRCVARYGYTDLHNAQEPFEELLVKKLKEFVKDGCSIPQQTSNEGVCEKQEELNDGMVDKTNEFVEIQQEALMDAEVQLQAIDEAWSSGVTHLIGESEVMAAKGSGIAKRILIDYAYNFMKRNLRQREELFDIPRERMLKVGMTYEL